MGIAENGTSVNVDRPTADDPFVAEAPWEPEVHGREKGGRGHLTDDDADGSGQTAFRGALGGRVDIPGGRPGRDLWQEAARCDDVAPGQAFVDRLGAEVPAPLGDVRGGLLGGGSFSPGRHELDVQGLDTAGRTLEPSSPALEIA